MRHFENMTRGDQLSADDQRKALATYVHRFTKEHRPAWSREPRKDGKPYPVQFASDADWLANTEFPVSPKTGRLASGDCLSSPTWPDNPELRRA
jgi:hypothetical protein